MYSEYTVQQTAFIVNNDNIMHVPENMTYVNDLIVIFLLRQNHIPVLLLSIHLITEVDCITVSWKPCSI